METHRSFGHCRNCMNLDFDRCMSVQPDFRHLKDVDPVPCPNPLNLFGMVSNAGQVKFVPIDFESRCVLDSFSEMMQDGVQFSGNFSFGDPQLGLDVSGNTVFSLERLHYVENINESRTPADNEKHQHRFSVWGLVIPDAIGRENGIEPVVALHDECGFLFWRLWLFHD